MTWPNIRMAELFRVRHGYAFKGQYFDIDGPYVLLTPGNFHEKGGYRDQGDKTKFYTGDVPEGYVLDEGDLLVAMTEQSPGLLGSSAWIPESGRFLHNQRLGRVVDLVENRLSKRFLYFLFNTQEVRQQISARASGGKVRHTAPERIGQVVVRLPPLDVQRRIADVLTAYDDLVENNQRRMKLLEEVARQLYREWFVRFRFPGHEHTRITNCVPDGWEKTTAYSSMEVLSGGTPKTNVPDYWDGDIPFYTPKDAADTCYVLKTERAITELGLKNCNSQLYETDTLFISARGTVGKLNLASRPMARSQSCYALIGKGNISQLFLFCALKEAIEQFKQHAVGAVFDAIVVDTFKLISFVVPDEKNIRHFHELVAPVFRQVSNLMEQNDKLRAARDLLLPRLMSGAIAV
jgi:type I restriction enzyme S subunit